MCHDKNKLNPGLVALYEVQSENTLDPFLHCLKQKCNTAENDESKMEWKLHSLINHMTSY